MTQAAIPRMSTCLHLLRRAAQLGLVAAAAATGYRFAAGLSVTSVERYCPMGGLATSYSLATQARFACATGELNLALLVALLILALVARKAFCSWLCPVGTVAELVGLAAGRTHKPAARACDLGLLAPEPRLDKWLRRLRFLVLAVVLAATFRTAELVFRPFCPYYVMFSLHGHDVELWSYGLLALFVAGAVAVPFLWCRYLCPLAAALWPFSRAGLLRIRRDAERCTGCGRCERACGHSLPVATTNAVTSGECTLCLECLRKCPAEGALSVGLGHASLRLPRLVVPAAVALAVAAGAGGGHLLAVPSFSKVFASEPVSARPAEVRFVVRGVRCVDTAKLAATVFDGIPGVQSLSAFASRSEVVVAYDASVIDVAGLVRLLQGPVYMPASREFVFHVFQVISIDGMPVGEATVGSDPPARRKE